MKELTIATDRIEEIDAVVDALCHPDSYKAVSHSPLHGEDMPSREKLAEIMQRLRAALFPGFYGPTQVRLESMRYHLAANLDSITHMLAAQIRAGACFSCVDFAQDCTTCARTARSMAIEFIQRLPEIRSLLASDVQAAYEGDPAARNPGETIFCYPSITTMINHRVAHALYEIGVPLIPRIISEMAHSTTGIDIHPGATIGRHFFIDHGTGVVIGETCVIGDNCQLYQGVTLGALSFPKEADGTLVKGIPRHPILEDDVTVYAGATVLGRVTIGKGSVIGGNVWVTHDVPPFSKVMQRS